MKDRREKSGNADGVSRHAVSQSIRMRAAFLAGALILVGFGVVIGRIAYLQFVKGEEYRANAAAQQLADTEITPKRGTIYDANMNEIARSVTVWNVVVSPKAMEEAGTNINQVAIQLAEILDITSEEIMEKLMKTDSSYQIVKKKVEMPVANEIRQWMSDYNATEAAETSPIVGITLEEDSKRYYPYGSFASHLIGFTSSDGYGLTGLELYYNDTLEGTAGRVITAQTAQGDLLEEEYSVEYPAQDGNSLVLTIDQNIQSLTEKYLRAAVKEHNVANRGVAIVMNVNTGAILAMATMPDYDLMDPYTLNDEALANEINAIVDETERSEARVKAQNEMWRNKAVSEVYEPGSVFKVVTASAALDSGSATLDTTHTCVGSEKVLDTTFRCAETAGHGTLNFAAAINYSCNPYYINLGLTMGAHTFCSYLQSFGFYEKTGIDAASEVKSVVVSEENMGSVSLASSAFGQTSTVTPIEMITAFSAAVNGGKLVQPYVVQTVLDSEGNVVSEHETVVKRQVISEEVSETIRYLLEGTVDKELGASLGYTSHNTAAKVDGYRVGGKSGTSQKQSVKEGNEDDSLRIASFCGFAPADDPEIAVLVVLDEPHSWSEYGGSLAGPVVSSILGEALPYLGFEPQYTEEELANRDVTVPTLTTEGENEFSKAQRKLNDLGLSFYVVGEEGANVVAQFPEAGTKVSRDSTIILYTGSTEQTMTAVPNLVGLTLSQVQNTLESKHLNLRIEGTDSTGSSVVAATQDIAEGTEVALGTVITVTFHDTSVTD